MVKLALCDQTFEEYLGSALDELDFAALLEPWAAQFGKENLIARVYDGKAGSVLGDFLRCLPVLSDCLAQLEEDASPSNASVGYLALQLFRTLNQFAFPEQRLHYQQLHETIRSFDLPALLFNSEEARALRDRFAVSNERFIREYLGGRGNDLGGRRYSDTERDQIRSDIQKLQKHLGT